MVGKWHLGDYSTDPRYNPLRHGFDFQFGVPYSNDMRPLPLYRNEEQLEADVADLSVLTGRYTDEAVRFMAAAAGRPFFLYFAHTFPHRPLAVSEPFAGTSAAGLYGDVVDEVDASVGRILDALDAMGAAGSTLVFFTSDNGPGTTAARVPSAAARGSRSREATGSRSWRASRGSPLPARSVRRRPATSTSSPPASRPRASRLPRTG
jgi:arylsulfatase A-like enzyme